MFSPFVEFFVFGTFWFWALIAAEFCVLFAFERYEKGWGATLSLLAFGAMLQWFGNVNILGFLWAHPIEVIGFLGAYLLIGFGWSTFKWFDFVIGRKHEYEEMKADFLRSNGLPSSTKVVPENLKKKWTDHLGWNHKEKWGEAPQIRDNKARWMHWASMWPVSAVCYLLGDMIANLFNSIYRRVAHWYQAKADQIWEKAGIKDDFNSTTGNDE